MSKYTPLAFEINPDPAGYVFDVGSLFDKLCTLRDQRDARGLRYRLVSVLLLVVMAKLAGEDCLRGIAQWVALRKEVLADLLGLCKPLAPHHTTYSRILGHAVGVDDLGRVVNSFFAQRPGAGESVVISLDGKTVRGTIPAGASRGLHLLAAYLPDEGWVVMQVEAGGKENEITAAPRLLRSLDLRGKVVTADALLAQRELDIQIVEAGGDYISLIKGNQRDTRDDIEMLFGPEPCAPGFSPGQKVYATAQTTDKGHGRIEHRTITVSSELNDYLNWPHVRQVFKLERRFTRIKDGRVSQQVVYGVTSLTAEEASPKRLLHLIRQHWQIENGLHYRRDDTLREDRCTLRTGHAAQTMTIINNLVLGLLLGHGVRNVPDARRRFDVHLEEAAALVTCSP